jgi:hypothetical protein
MQRAGWRWYRDGDNNHIRFLRRWYWLWSIEIFERLGEGQGDSDGDRDGSSGVAGDAGIVEELEELEAERGEVGSLYKIGTMVVTGKAEIVACY